MAEHRDPEPNAPHNPPDSVVNPAVRRTALRTYLGPIVALFVVFGLALAYWSTRPDPDPAAVDQTRGTTGLTPEREETPGGHDPQPTPESTGEEIERRAGDAITELGEVIEEDGRFEIGRRVEVHDVEVERVESPTLIWVRDGNARVAVIMPAGRTASTGEQVSITGVIERAGDSARIRASRVTPSEQ